MYTVLHPWDTFEQLRFPFAGRQPGNAFSCIILCGRAPNGRVGGGMATINLLHSPADS